MQKKIDSYKDHTIICGYGRNGKQAATKLLAYNRPFVIIEKDKEIYDKYQSEMVPFVLGNANEDEVLIQAGIERAGTLISALPNDADNLFVVLSARQINSELCIISRASQETSYNKLKMAGANNVILPDKIGGDHMASLVVVPDLIEFIDNLFPSDLHDPADVLLLPEHELVHGGVRLPPLVGQALLLLLAVNAGVRLGQGADDTHQDGAQLK